MRRRESTCHYGEPLFAVACLLFGLGAHSAGLREIAIPADPAGPQISATLWTPCDLAAEPVKVDSGGVVLTIDGVEDCAVGREHLPLILISHGMFGDRYSHYDTAAYLADAGFAVLSVSHPLDFVSARRESVDNLSSFIARPHDIKRAISFMLSDAQTFVSIDPQRIGFFGFSRGGYTGLVLAGGAPDFRAPAFPCPEEFVMCQQIRDNAIPVYPPGDDLRIRSFVIADPVSFFPDQASLRSANRPIQLWSSGLGGMGVRPEEVTAVKTNLPHAPEFHRVDGAGHLSFQFPCTDEVAKAMAFVCTDPPGFNRKAFHATLNAQVLNFFRRQLRDDAAAAARAGSG